jgi:hypothetical protein
VSEYQKLLTAGKADWGKVKTWWDAGWRYAVISGAVLMIVYGCHSGLIK